MGLKNIVRFFLRKIGYTMRHYNLLTDPELMIGQWLICANIELVLDIGANEGQFYKSTRTHGYQKKIICFEPLKDACQVLSQHLETDPQLKIIQKAVGDFSGEISLYQSKNSVSSSLLKMLPKHYETEPESIYIGSNTVSIVKLDDLFGNIIPENLSNIFLKIDTQGYEWQVLKGIEKNFSKVSAVLLELSVVPLYENQKLYHEFITFFLDNGFTLFSIIPGFSNKNSGQLLQFDALFVRGDG